MTTLRVKKFAAHDPRTGRRIGPPRLTLPMAERDAERAMRKGQEAVAKPVGELRG